MESINNLKEDLFTAIRIICEEYETKHLPKFKVPGWYLYRDHMGLIVFYATIKDGNYFKNNSGEVWFIKDCRPAAPQEIESHLRKIAEEKGFKEGVKAKYNNSDIREMTGLFHYVPDWQIAYGAFCIGNNVIFDDKDGWRCEIIPDKKKLPCTKDEATKLIQEYTAYYRKDSGCNVFEFLNEYIE